MGITKSRDFSREETQEDLAHPGPGSFDEINRSWLLTLSKRALLASCVFGSLGFWAFDVLRTFLCQAGRSWGGL